MYLFPELLFLSPLAAYAYFRSLRLIAGRGGRLVFTVFFLFLVAGYPVAETLSHRAGGAAVRGLVLAGYIALPFLLYLVLAAVLIDLVLKALRLSGALSKAAVASRRFRAWRFRAGLILPALIVLAGIVNFRWLRVREFVVEVPRGAASAQRGTTAATRMKVAFAADFHLGRFTAPGFLEDFVRRVNALEPDLVLIGGDVLEGDLKDEDTAAYESKFRRIRARYGVFGVPGNHESHRGNHRDFYTAAGIRLLEDEVVRIDAAVDLAGRSDRRSGGRMRVEDLVRKAPGGLPVILLDHRPSDIRSAVDAGVDILLSGHTHHGQLFPANWITGYRYEVSWGHKKIGRTHVIVTSGIQLWGPPVRTAGFSEILVLDVVFRDAP
jgi:predicted MPP superfamily phosphohydrolase